jgi:hypothetical protein
VDGTTAVVAGAFGDLVGVVLAGVLFSLIDFLMTAMGVFSKLDFENRCCTLAYCMCDAKPCANRNLLIINQLSCERTAG